MKVATNRYQASEVVVPPAVVGALSDSNFGPTVDQDQNRTDRWTACLVQVKERRDAREFAALFGHFAPRVKYFLMKAGAPEALAEESVQEAMAQVWHKAHLFDPAKASASTWIFTIVRNKRIDALRKERRPEPEELPWGQENPADAADIVETSQEMQRLTKALAALPQEQRAMVEKAYLGELSHSEIADMTGLPLGTIKSRIRLGLEHLRRELSVRS